MAAMRRISLPYLYPADRMEAGEWNGQHLDLIDAMIKSADDSVSDQEVAEYRTECLSYLWMLFRNVYGKLDELSE